MLRQSGAAVRCSADDPNAPTVFSFFLVLFHSFQPQISIRLKVRSSYQLRSFDCESPRLVRIIVTNILLIHAFDYDVFAVAFISYVFLQAEQLEAESEATTAQAASNKLLSVLFCPSLDTHPLSSMAHKTKGELLQQQS